MSHHRNTCAQDHLDSRTHLASTLKFHAVGTRLLHNAHSVALCLDGVTLIGAERHIHNNHRALDGAGNGAAIDNHVIDSDGNGRGIALHDVGGAIAH